jgi:hypothetical protein
MSKEKIKEAILKVAGYPNVGWVVENADFLAEEIDNELNSKERIKHTPTDISVQAVSPISKLIN